MSGSDGEADPVDESSGETPMDDARQEQNPNDLVDESSGETPMDDARQEQNPNEETDPGGSGPSGPARAVLAPGFVFADVVRKSGRETYVVQMQGNPGFHEVHCCAQHVLAPRENDLVNADAFAFSTGVCPSVALSLGPFCLKKHMFLNCTLQCPPNYVIKASKDAPGVGLKRRKWGSAGGAN